MNLQTAVDVITLILQVRFPSTTLAKVAGYLEEKDIRVGGVLVMSETKLITTVAMQVEMDDELREEHIKFIAGLPGVLSVDEGRKMDGNNVLRALLPYLNTK